MMYLEHICLGIACRIIHVIMRFYVAQVAILAAILTCWNLSILVTAAIILKRFDASIRAKGKL